MLRRSFSFSLLTLLAFAPVSGRAAAMRSAGAAEVLAMRSVPAVGADLIVLGAGFDAGLRQGMVCRVTRGSSAVGEILLVELRSNCSAALILNLAAGQSIHVGDVAAIKVLKT